MLNIDAFIESIDYLPPIPQNLAQLVELLDRPDTDLERVVSLIQYDPAMTAQLMRACNSAYFGGSSPASDLYEATARLGFNEVFQLVTSFSTAGLMRPAQKGYGIEAGELWKHCVSAALAGKALAIERDMNASLVFTACILHDIGKLVLSRSLEARYDEVLAVALDRQLPMLEVENELLGFNHAQIGGKLLEKWKFPISLAEAVRFHHDPAGGGEHSWLAAYAYMGNMISCCMGLGCGHYALALTSRAEALELVGVKPEDVPDCMTRAFYAIRDAQAILSMNLGA